MVFKTSTYCFLIPNPNFDSGPNIGGWSKETGQSYDSSYKQFTSLSPIDRWEPEWFTKINSGDYIEREIELKGYAKLPAGNYLCQFKYSGPTKIEKEERYLFDGRYWLGEVNTNTIEISIP